MWDMKYEIQMLAEAAAERDGRDFHSLPLDRQCAYYGDALQEWTERKIQAADLARDREREG